MAEIDVRSSQCPGHVGTRWSKRGRQRRAKRHKGKNRSFLFETKSPLNLWWRLIWQTLSAERRYTVFIAIFKKMTYARLSWAISNMQWTFFGAKIFYTTYCSRYCPKGTLFTVPDIFTVLCGRPLCNTQDRDYLGGTAEVPMMAFHPTSLLKNELPKRYPAFFAVLSAREAGSHGKDAKGLIRVHEYL